MGVYREAGLAVGWEPETPVGDTVLRRFLANWARMQRVLVGGMGGTVLERPDVVAADLARPSAWLDVAVLTQPVQDVADLMESLEGLYGAAGATGLAGVFSAWPTPDLRPFGWRLGGHPPFMYRPLGGEPPPWPVDCEIERVTDRAGLVDFARVIRDGYPIPDLSEDPDEVFTPWVLGLAGLHLYVLREHGRALAVSAAFVADGINGVTLIATLPEARGRGLGEAVSWAATLTDPALPAGLVASDDGRPIYERMGYLPVLRFTFWYRDRPGVA